MEMDNNLLYFVLFLIAFWLVLDQFYGEKYITKSILLMLPEEEKNGWWSILF